MSRIKMAFPAVVRLLALSVRSQGQTFVETPGAPVVPRAVQSPAQTPAQSPADSSVIVVKTVLTEDQLATLYIARKGYRETPSSDNRPSAQNPLKPLYLYTLGTSLHQPCVS